MAVKKYCRWCLRAVYPSAAGSVYTDRKNRMLCKKNPNRANGLHDPVIVLVRVIQTCGVSPNQWDAWDIDGEYWYLRFSHGVGTMSRNYDTDSAEFKFEDSGVSSILLTDFLRYMGAVLYSDAQRLNTSWQLPPRRPVLATLPAQSDVKCKWCGSSLGAWTRTNLLGEIRESVYLDEKGSETCLKRPIVNGEAWHEPAPTWIQVVNAKTGAKASALELTGNRVNHAQDIFGSPSVKEGWWVLKYDDHSVRLYNPENFRDSYRQKQR